MAEQNIVIVGAGIAGLAAALLSKHEYPNVQVTVVESAAQVGGLLRSVQHEGHSFYLGTHIPELTQHKLLDSLLFPPTCIAQNQQLSQLKVGSYFRGRFNPFSQFIEISSQDSDYCLILNELLQTQSLPETEVDAHLLARLERSYGPQLTSQVFSPLVNKLTAEPLSSLTVDAMQFYGLARLTIGNRQIAANLKKIAHLDQVLAYYDDSEHPRTGTWVYPRQRGIGAWSTFLYKQCLEKGVQFLLNQSVNQVRLTAKNTYDVILMDQAVLTASKLVWTLPFYTPFTSIKSQRVSSRPLAIYHFISQKPFNTDKHYIYCHEANFVSYRLTIYDNLFDEKQQSTTHRLSVEVIGDESQALAEQIMVELERMTLIDDVGLVRCVGIDYLPYGFPISKVAEQQQARLAYQKVKQSFPQVLFVGRANPSLFFTTAVLLDVAQQFCHDKEHNL